MVLGKYLLITPDKEHNSVRASLPLSLQDHQDQEAEEHGACPVRPGENTILGRTSDPREWLLVEEREDVFHPRESVSRILDIEYLSVEEFGKWRKQLVITVREPRRF